MAYLFGVVQVASGDCTGDSDDGECHLRTFEVVHSCLQEAVHATGIETRELVDCFKDPECSDTVMGCVERDLATTESR
ncbi:hypothetical protein FGIG_01579 [Fasciola gigantica]|uniref:Uncharacterized protein n=1 Tax=Fasciola gigantica TaxID=46835 RepID=A0A504YNH8_FASGI|nr:hypothetical protein FGIG_01579 [Fasciola gigantica]